MAVAVALLPRPGNGLQRWLSGGGTELADHKVTQLQLDLVRPAAKDRDTSMPQILQEERWDTRGSRAWEGCKGTTLIAISR